MIELLNKFLSHFKNFKVQVHLTDKFYRSFYFDGLEYYEEEPLYRKCHVSVDNYASIEGYETNLRQFADQLISDYNLWKQGKSRDDIRDITREMVFLVKDLLLDYSIKESSDNILIRNEGRNYHVNDIFCSKYLNICIIGNLDHPLSKESINDDEPTISLYLEIQYNILSRIVTYFNGYLETVLSIDAPRKKHDSFSLQDKVQYNISNATALKEYLENRGLIINGDTYDIYRLFRNKGLNCKIQWIKGPGHLKHFIQILKHEKIIKNEVIFETIINCFEFVGDGYDKPMSISSIQHGHIPKKHILKPEKIRKCFFN